MKQIPLTKGQFALVDDEDFEFVNKQKWYADSCNETFYARARPKKYGPLIHMHRVILSVPNSCSIFVDHIDHNGLNNQKYNLRIATRSQNNANKKAIGKSKYLGVFYKKESTFRPWYSRCLKNGVNKYLGSFKTEIEAAMAYNNAAFEIHGEFANLNIIDTTADIHSTADIEVMQ